MVGGSLKDKKPKVGILMTLSEVYRRNLPKMPAEFAAYWRGVLRDILADHADLLFTEAAHTDEEVSTAVSTCEEAGCDLLMLLPMAYAPSGAAVKALSASRLPLAVISTARDASLPYDMGGDHLLRNQGLHGAIDLANALRRSGRDFHLAAGHGSQTPFRESLQRCVRVAAGARVMQRARVGRIGEPFAGMLDLSYDPANLAESLGFDVIPIAARELGVFARKVGLKRIRDYAEWARQRFQVDPGLTADELTVNAAWSLALEDVVAENSLAAVAMNFMNVIQAGADALPFLGAGRLMSRGVGYAGEGDVLSACFVTALARIAGEATFTELYSADYERNEILLTHMGECNFALADPERPVKLLAREFAWGNCRRLAVPVFQLRPGRVTLASITETPAVQTAAGWTFQLVVLAGNIVAAPEHVNLRVPYSRLRLTDELPRFVEGYSRATGTHHLALAYGDLREEMSMLARLCQIGCKTL